VQKLFDAVTAKKVDETKPARDFSDYKILIDHDAIPQSVKILNELL
jgi:CRISPR-associated protein Csd2